MPSLPALLWVLISVLSSSAGVSDIPLPLGKTISVNSPSGVPRCFSFPLDAGDFARVDADQFFLDLAIEIHSPNSAAARRVDGTQSGSETASVLATSSGIHRACVSPAHGAAGPFRFSIALAEVRRAVTRDADRLRAESLMTHAAALQSENSAAGNRKALEEFREALAILDRPGEPRELSAAVLVRVGDCLNATADYSAARIEYAKALELDPGQRSRVSGEALANSAVAARRTGDIEAAREGFARALKVFSDLRGTQASASLDLAIAETENDAGLAALDVAEYQKALEYFLLAMPGMRRDGDRATYGIVLTNIALAYRYLGDYPKSETYLQRALPLFGTAADRPARARALMNLARLHGIEGDTKGAAALFQRARPFVEDIPALKADLENNLGQLALRSGEPREALLHLDGAMEIYRAKGDLRNQASVLYYRGRAQAEQGDTEAAMAALRGALDLRESLGLDDQTADTLLEIARLERKRGDHAAATQTLVRAMDLSERLRVRLAAPDLRAMWFSGKEAVYEELIDLAYEDKAQRPESPASAFGYSERARARSLNDVLRLKSHRGGGNAGGVVRAIAYRARELDRLASVANPGDRRARLSREMDDLELQYQAVAGRNGANPPGASPDSVGIPDAQAMLGPDAVLLEFSLGSGHSYLWAIGRNSKQWFRLAPKSEIERQARNFIRLLQAKDRRAADPTLEGRYRAASAQLSHTLFGEAASGIRGKRVVLCLDGILRYVPLEALPSPNTPSLPFGIDHEVSRIPSVASVMTLPPRSAPNSASRVAVFADPVFRGDPRATAQVQATRGFALARLPFTENEAAAIASRAGAGRIVSRIGFAATKEELAAPAVRSANILHIATHATVDLQNPERSGIRLTEVTRNGKETDGFLSLNEIYNLNLPMDLTVLSACETGGGRDAGEAILSLGRAFFFSGSRRVVYSLWKTSDEGTALFMAEFYRNLLKSGNVSPAASIRKAREAMWRSGRWRDAYYWAAFALEGDPRPMEAPAT